MASAGFRRLLVLAASSALLVGCGAGAENVEQAVGDAPAGGSVGATPEPGTDGTPGEGHGGSKGGVGGKGGSASSSTKQAGIDGWPKLECASGMVWSTGGDYEPGAFDSPTAAKTAREALRRALRSYRSFAAGLEFRRLSGQSPYEDGKQVTFAGVADDGSAQMFVTVEQRPESKRWLPIGEEGCSSASPRPGAPST